MDKQRKHAPSGSTKHPTPSDTLGTRHSAIGTVKWCRDDKGYGAIVVDEFEPWDIWYHYTSIEQKHYAILQSGERAELIRDAEGRFCFATGEIYSGSTATDESRTLVPGERVVVDFRRIDQDSFRYVAESVRRLDNPRFGLDPAVSSGPRTSGGN